MAIAHCWGDPRVESPVDVLIPGDETGIPPGFGEVAVGEVEDAGPVEDNG